MRTLSLSMRPTNFGRLIGQGLLTNAILKHYKSKREPTAWLFYGETGCGKTTLARILALSLQCVHAQFGFPCKDCRKEKSIYNIAEINASEVSGVEDIEKVVEVASYEPMPPSRRRVFILDEAQRLSPAAQNMLLKYFEDAPKTTVWIVCTTEPGKILRTLRSRCLTYEMLQLRAKDVKLLITSAAEKAGFTKSIDDFEEHVLNQGIRSPRMILMAMEKYLAGIKAEDAVLSSEANVNVLAICRAVVKGDLETVHSEIRTATIEDAKILRERLAMYLNTMLLEELGPADNLTWGITNLARVSSTPEGMQLPYTNAVLHILSRKFGGGKVEDDLD